MAALSVDAMPERENGATRVIAITGSLRRGSFNRLLLRAAQGLAPVGMAIELSI